MDISHAKGFGQYLADNPGWVAPALLIHDTGGCRFEPISEHGSADTSPPRGPSAASGA
ncbi:hypothetical protein ACWGLE_00825 [Streptomyces sp. NPDC055897]